MEIKRYRIVAIGAKQPDILSKISRELTQLHYEIEAISSLRLGHSTIVVCLIEAIQEEDSIKKYLNNIFAKDQIKLIIDECSREKFKFIKSDTFIRIRGEHEAGSKAYVISELINSGLDIHGLETDNYEVNDTQKFVMSIKGKSKNEVNDLSLIANKFIKQGLDVAIATSWELLV